jgi:hypothetical protein
MNLIPLSWKIGAVAVLLVLLSVGHVARVRHAYTTGHEAAVTERAAADALAVSKRLKENAATGVKQAASNATITKVKNEEIAPVRERIVTKRVYVGSAICSGPTTPTDSKSAASSDGTNPSGRLVRADVERDIRALKLAVEEDLATGRACQSFLRDNSLVP